MFLSINVLGDSINVTAIPPQKQYNSVKFVGKCYLDNISMKRITISDDEIINTNIEQQWNLDSLFLANFNENLEGGNLQNDGLPITQWKIRRKEKNEQIYKLIATLNSSSIDSSYIDYTPKSSTEYDYTIYPVSNSIEGLGLEAQNMVVFDNWILTSLDSQISYTFDMEVETDSINNEDDVNIYKNNTKYAAVRFGESRYKVGGITAIPYQLNDGDLVINNDLLVAIENFIYDGEVKILKNGNGFSAKVITHGFSIKYNDKLGSQIYSISFKWVEVGEE